MPFHSSCHHLPAKPICSLSAMPKCAHEFELVREVWFEVLCGYLPCQGSTQIVMHDKHSSLRVGVATPIARTVDLISHIHPAIVTVWRINGSKRVHVKWVVFEPVKNEEFSSSD